jgi:Site-specific recombinases, DNA invertase Pin homologs
MKAAIYSRKSRFTGKGESIENQIQMCREYGIKYLGIFEIDFAVYEDEGFSGGNINRPKFQRLMKDARERKFDVLICYRLDRVSRNVTDFSQLIRELNRYNVNFVSIREQFDTTTPMGRAMMYLASVFSQLERETIAERIKDNMLQLAKTGRWLGGTTPTGYRSEAVTYIDNGGKERKMHSLAPIPGEIDLVKLIYEKYLKKKSITGVEKYLAENNIRTKNKRLFHRYSIRTILANPVYAIADKELYEYLVDKGYDVCAGPDDFNGINGLLGYNKTRQDKEDGRERYRDVSEWIIAVGQHSGIIPGSGWKRAQELLDNNRNKAYRKVKTSKALLSGILRCGCCGSHMRPKTVKRINKNGEQVFYYMCELKEKSRKSQCDIQNINGNLLDEAVLNALKHIYEKNPPLFIGYDKKTDIVVDARDEIVNENEIIKIRIKEIDSEIQNLAVAIAKGRKTEVLSVLLAKMDSLTDEKEELLMLQKQLEIGKNLKVDEEIGVESIVQHILNMDEYIWNAMDAGEKINMIKSMVEKIIWDGKKLDIVLFGSKP